MGRHVAVLGVAAAPGTQQQNGGQGDPAADGMHHHRAGEVMELGTEGGFQPGLDAQVVVPGNALKKGIDKAHQQEGGDALGVEARPLGDATGDDGRDGCREGEQEEELDHLVAALLGQYLGAGEEVGTVGHGVADEEVGEGRDTEIRQDLDQGIDLVLLADGAEFEKGKAGVHGQHHDGAQQDEEDIAGVICLLHFGLRKRSEAPSRCCASLIFGKTSVKTGY
jgi:hypothetical protein